MERTLSCEFFIIVSTWTLTELYKNIEHNNAEILLKMLKHKTTFIKHSEADIKRAKTLSSHYQDALHAILAKKAQADYLITRDIKGFRNLKYLIQSKLPEDI